MDPLFVQWVQKNIGTGNIKEEKHNYTGLADLNGVKIEEFYDDVTENDNWFSSLNKPRSEEKYMEMIPKFGIVKREQLRKIVQ